jgi:alpha,alpha-trehalase
MITLFLYSDKPPSTLDYETANDPTLNTLNESERAELYSQLASGAETGRNFLSALFK